MTEPRHTGDSGGPMSALDRLLARVDGLDGLGHRSAGAVAVEIAPVRSTLTASRARERHRGGCCG